MSDLIKNIKRIAETEELKRLIEQLLNQDGELAERGTIGKSSYTAYSDSTGAINGKGGEGPQTDPGTSSPTDGNTDDAISENDGLKDKDGDELSDGDIGIGDKMDRITDLEDCSTGEKLEIITTDNFIPPNLNGLEGYTAEDWEDGNDPRNESYDSGQYYSNAVGGGAVDSITGYGYAELIVSERDTLFPADAPHSLDSFSYTSGSPSSITFTVLKANGDVDTTITLAAQNCPAAGNPGLCSQVPTSQDWPADNIHQLKWDGGRFVTSAYEPLADQHGPWQNSPSKITACTAAGDQITFQGANDGSLLATVDTGTASGNTYKINNKGIVTDIFTSSVSHLLPKGT